MDTTSWAPQPAPVPQSPSAPAGPFVPPAPADPTTSWRTPRWGTPAAGWERPDPGAPPTDRQVPTPGASRPSPSKGSRGWVAAATLVAVAALAFGGAGVAVGQALDREASTGSAAPVAAGGGATTPTVSPGDSEEPVAAVAAALSPSVVQIETGQSVGSGFVYDAQGLILTAAHVVEGSQQVEVVLADGRRLEGTVVGADSGSDIGVVRVEADELTAAALALDEPAEVGQLAVAIGSPFGLDQTVTSGIVSAVGRTVETPGGAGSMIQTDAPINPGNSGGALADRQGRVIGVNVSIASESGGNVGVGFAVPIATAKDIADRLVAGQPITNGYLGVGAAAATDGSAGALVQQVSPGSPAEEAGLQEGDVITAVDGEAIAAPADLVAAIRSRQPGDEVVLTVDRQGEGAEVSVTLAEAPTS